MQPDTDYKRIFLALFLAALVLFGWQMKVEWPRRQALAQFQAKQAETLEKEKAVQAREAATKHKAADPEENISLTHDQRLSASPRIAIKSATLDGTIALKGARFDDLSLVKYRTELDPTSPEVTLFSPPGDEQAYFAQIGWVAGDDTKIPTQDTLWQADKKQLTPQSPVQLRWNNGEGVTFTMTVALDEHYMFTVTQLVENKSGHVVSVMPYAFLNRSYKESAQHYAILHEGPLGVLDGALSEIKYKDLRDAPKKFENTTGWLGLTDKYWQAALIPAQDAFTANFSHYSKNSQDRYQADYLGQALKLDDGGRAQSSVRLFAGAKEIKVLDRYTNGDADHAPILLFDRSVDFGALYFLTKPMFLMLNFFYTQIGNFGVAILLLTIVVKFIMFPLANKSFHSSAQMRALQPDMARLREKYFDDKIKMNQELMALYKREKVNPAAGCLPVLIQMPVFFALYKVLFVTIEMRHAPFFGWLKDLSAPDPSNLFTAFGLIPWTPPFAWMHLGLLPMLMCATMVIQMKQQPKPADPMQAKMMGFMPYFFLFIFNGFPAGLVLYWVWSNSLSILQQAVIARGHKRKMPGAKAAA